MDLITLLGISGSFIVLVAFLLNQSNKLSNESLIYDFLNFLGSLILLLYAFQIQSLPFVIINTIWGLSSLKDVVITLMKRFGANIIQK